MKICEINFFTKEVLKTSTLQTVGSFEINSPSQINSFK